MTKPGTKINGCVIQHVYKCLTKLYYVAEIASDATISNEKLSYLGAAN